MKKLLLLGIFCFISILANAQTYTITLVNNYADNFALDAALELYCNSLSTKDFEEALNNPYNHMSNLDIDNDGYIDYLRCIEREEYGKIYVYIQACLFNNTFYDVAYITVERRTSTHAVYITGCSDIYGIDYVVYPRYTYNYNIFMWVYRPIWHPWVSPYCWAHYPTFFRHHPPVAPEIYRWRNDHRPHYGYNPRPYARPLNDRHVTRVANPAQNDSRSNNGNHSSAYANPPAQNNSSRSRTVTTTTQPSRTATTQPSNRQSSSSSRSGYQPSRTNTQTTINRSSSNSSSRSSQTTNRQSNNSSSRSATQPSRTSTSTATRQPSTSSSRQATQPVRTSSGSRSSQSSSSSTRVSTPSKTVKR